MACTLCFCAWLRRHHLIYVRVGWARVVLFCNLLSSFCVCVCLVSRVGLFVPFLKFAQVQSTEERSRHSHPCQKTNQVQLSVKKGQLLLGTPAPR